ncbi:MAG: hypothetical protein WAN61_01525 [Minisyncoccia bacterium]
MSDIQLAKLSDIIADLGVVVIASVVLPTILETTMRTSVVVTGTSVALFFWLISIVLLKT